jgi:DNA topoisomerase-2
LSSGKYEEVDTNAIRVTELPAGMWNNKFIEHLDKLVETKKIKDYLNNCTDTEVDILIKIDDLLINIDLIKLLKLQTDLKISNMIAFNELGKLQKYESVEDILESFYEIRYKAYEERKQYLIDKINHEKKIIQNKGNFIQHIIGGQLILNNKKKEDIIVELESLKLDKIDDSYDYLTNMNLISLSKEKLDDLKQQFTDIKNKLKVIKDTSIEDMWLEDLKNIIVK